MSKKQTYVALRELVGFHTGEMVHYLIIGDIRGAFVEADLIRALLDGYLGCQNIQEEKPA